MHFFELWDVHGRDDGLGSAACVGPPATMLGEFLRASATVARSNRCAIRIADFVVYRNGFEFGLKVRPADSVRERHPSGRPHTMPWLPLDYGSLSDDLLRLGVQFATGAKVTSLDRFRISDKPHQACLEIAGWETTQGWDLVCWTEPLPSKAPLHLVVEWPVFGIEMTRFVLPAREIILSSRVARSIWP
jgi:hypothetical protein